MPLEYILLDINKKFSEIDVVMKAEVDELRYITR